MGATMAPGTGGHLSMSMKSKEKRFKDDKTKGDEQGQVNIPQDPKIINDTMRLIDRIMSEDVIKKWLQLV